MGEGWREREGDQKGKRQMEKEKTAKGVKKEDKSTA